jgi:hypothetical protein
MRTTLDGEATPRVVGQAAEVNTLLLSTAAGCRWGVAPSGPSWALPYWSLW